MRVWLTTVWCGGVGNEGRDLWNMLSRVVKVC